MREVIRKFLSDKFGYEEEELINELMRELIKEVSKDKEFD